MKTIQLSNYCRWNDSKSVSQFIDNNNDINILYNEGIYFKFAFKHNNNDMLHKLIEFYYNQHNLAQPIENYNFEQKEKKYGLLQVLEECVESYGISKEIDKVLQEYSINLAEDNSSVGDLEEEYEVDLIEKNGSQSTADHNNSPQKEEILKDIINHHSSVGLLTSHNIQLLGQEGLVEAKDQLVIEDIKDHQI